MRLPWLLLASLASAVSAQTDETLKFNVTAPLDYQVFQRETKTNGLITVEVWLDTAARGPLTNLDALEARLLTAPPIRNSPNNWQPLPFDNRVRRFRARLAAPAGGWYRLEIRLSDHGRIVSETTVEHVGVGEVFVIAGQSNAANHGEGRQQSTNPCVVAFGNAHWQPANDPEPGATGNGGSFLPAFGDAMAQKFKVPIGLVAIGVGATSVRQWLPKDDAVAAPPDTGHNVVCIGSNSWVSTGELFNRITEVEKQLGPRGFRAVLWHQGESDSHEPPDRQITTETYRRYLQRVIESSRAEAGWRVPWFVAQVSYHSPQDQGWPELRAAQKSLVADGLGLAGPNTDELGPEFRQNHGKGVHFNARGLQRHGELWAEIVSAWLVQQLDASALDH
jgi:hypothetical protein